MELLLQDTETIPRLRKVLERIYEPAFYEVAKYVSRRGGSLEDAKDIAHDAILALYEQLENGREVKSEIAYVVGVAKNLWSARQKNAKLLDGTDALLNTLPEKRVPTLNQQKLLHFIEASGRRCLDLLSAFYMGGEKLKAIVKVLGFSSEHSASVQKYKCIEKIRETVRGKSMTYEDFFE